jgi:serine/threonine-protein kinase
MAFGSLPEFVEDLRKSRLLTAAQVDELQRIIVPRFSEPLGLAKDLARRGWLTVYQLNQMIQARGQELVLGPYRILDHLGKGGVSQVFKAWHTDQNCLVALKVIHPELVSNPEAVGRFQREVRAVSRLSHPNVVKAFADQSLGVVHFFAMEFVQGTDLNKLVHLSGPLPPPQACDAIRQAALGLQHAHEVGLVHRDIKPANLVLIAGGSVVKILDLGLARLRAGPDTAGRPDVVTMEGTLIGTPDYISPEQAKDPRSVDIRSDIYSLGCTLYYLLAGRPPFAGGSLMEKLFRHRMKEPPALSTFRDDVPSEVAAVVQKMISKQAGDRFATPAEVAAALAPFCPAA